MTKVTVFVPTFNQAKFLSQCLNSVLNQTRKPDQVLVIDDCSTDNTSEVIKNYKNRVEYIRHTKNLGAVKTYNHGLAIVKGDYILMVPGDDWLKKQILEKEAKILDSNSKVAMVYSQAIDTENGQQKLAAHHPAGSTSYIGRGNDFELLLTHGDFIPFLTVMVRKTVYKKLGFLDENLPYLHDHEMWIRIASKFPIAYLAQPLAYYRIHKSNLHKKENRLILYEEEFQYILNKYQKRLNLQLKKLVYYQFFINLSLNEAQRKNFPRSIAFILKALKLKPSVIIQPKTWRSIFYFLGKLINQISSRKKPKKKGGQIKLVLGCGPLPMHPMHYKWIDDTWTFTDLYPQNSQVIKLDARNTKYKTGNVDAIYASHILEHISHTETQSTLKEWHRILKSNGKLIINVPDLEWVCEQFLQNYRKNKPIKSKTYKSYEDLLLVFYGNQNAQGEFHQTGFTQKSLEKALKTASFSKIEVKKSIDAHQIGVLIATAIK